MKGFLEEEVPALSLKQEKIPSKGSRTEQAEERNGLVCDWMGCVVGGVARAMGSIQITKGLEWQPKKLDLHPEDQGVLLRAVSRWAT